MKHIGYELKKLLGVKYLLIFLAVLLCANGAVAFFTAQKAQPKGISSREISDFYDYYFTHRDEMDAYYAEMCEFEERQNELFREAMHSGNYDFEPEQWQNRYAPDGYTDRALFAAVKASIDSAGSYKSDMQKIINRAKSNLAEFESMGITSDSYTYKYQLRVIEIYEELRDNVKIGVEYSHGWSEYFAYDTVNIFIFAVLIMFGSVIFAQEKVNGFLPIIRTCRGGRLKTAFSKLCTMGIVTAVVVLLFTLTTFGVFGIVLGYSSAQNALQSLPNFKLSQYIIGIGQYFSVSVGVRLLTFLTFSALLILLSVFVYNYAIIYAGGLGFFGLNFLLYTLKYINADDPFKNLNFVATAAVSPLFARFRSINFFGSAWGYVSFMLTVFGILTAIGIAVTVLVFATRPSSGVSLSFLGRLGGRLRSTVSAFSSKLRGKKKIRCYTGSLYRFELHKTLIMSGMILLVLALMIVKAYFFTGDYTAKNSYSDAVYKEYMTVLEGELTDEKRQYIADERASINEIKSKYEYMREEYVAERIDYETYREYLKNYNYALSHDTFLKTVEEHRDYIVRTEKQTGVRAWFVYDTGWSHLVNTSPDFYLFAALLLLFAGSFANEYSSKSSSSGFAQLLRSTKRGRKPTFRTKMLSALTVSAVLSIVFNALELTVILKNYDTPAYNAPLLSVEQFGATGSRLTILQYVILMYALRIAASVLLALFVSALSQLTKKALPTLCVTAAVMLLPALVAYFGLTVADKVNFLNLFSATPLFIAGGTMIFTTLSVIIILSACFIARKKYL